MATYIEQAGVLAAIVSEAFGQHYDRLGVVILRINVEIQQRYVWILRARVSRVTVRGTPSFRSGATAKAQHRLACPASRGVREVMHRVPALAVPIPSVPVSGNSPRRGWGRPTSVRDPLWICRK
jgi:hypothetical protein